MKKPTLLFVEEVESILVNKILQEESINLVLLRFKQNNSFTKDHLLKTSKIPCFVLDKESSLDDEVERFQDFCKEKNIIVDHFFNDSEYHQELVQCFAWQLGLQGSLDEEQSRCVRDKAFMKDRIKEIGYQAMAYKELSCMDDAVDFANINGGFPIIVKWRRGLSSKEVYKIENVEQLKDLGLDYSSRRFIAEAYCPHLIWCFDSLVQNGEVIATFVTWLPYTNLSFAEKKEKFAQITVGNFQDEINFDGGKINQDIISNLKLKNGYLHLEAFVDSLGNPIICEFAWRTSGEHMLLNHSIAFNIDLYALLIDVMVGRKVKIPNLGKGKCVGDMFLPLLEGKITAISTYDELKDLEGVIDGAVNYKVGDYIQPKRQYTDSAGWLQVIGDTKDDVLNKMLNVYEKFRISVEK